MGCRQRLDIGDPFHLLPAAVGGTGWDEHGRATIFDGEGRAIELDCHHASRAEAIENRQAYSPSIA